MKLIYENYMRHPEIAKLCLNCKASDCDGLCDDYKNAVRRLLGMRPIHQLGRPVKLTPEKKPYIYRKRHDINGKLYTVREAADLTGIDYRTLYMRMYRNGMTLAEAVEIGGPCTARIRVGDENLTVREWAKRAGVNPRTVYGRIQRGYTPQQAVTMKRRASK